MNAKEKIVCCSGLELYNKIEEAINNKNITRKQATAMYKIWLEDRGKFSLTRQSIPYIIKQKYVSERQWDNKYAGGGYRFVEKGSDDRVLIEYRVVEDGYLENPQPIDIEDSLDVL